MKGVVSSRENLVLPLEQSVEASPPPQTLRASSVELRGRGWDTVHIV